MEIVLNARCSDGIERMTRFQVWRCADLDRRARMALIGEGAELIDEEDWDDDQFATHEKEAALAAGVQRGERFLVKFERA